MKFKLLAISIFVCTGLFSQKLAFQEQIKLSPFPNTSVTLSPSWVKQREDLNLTYLKSLDPERLLHNFRQNAGLPSTALPLGGWEAPQIGLRGHFVGHYLSAVSTIVEKYSDTILANRLNYLVDALYQCQQTFGNGYLSAFPEKELETLETKLCCVWAPYYTYHKIMQGLLDVHTRTGNKKAYEIVLGMADYVAIRMAKLDEQTIDKVLYSAGANPTNEAGGMNEVLYNLFSISNDPKHLALGKLFDRDWFVDPLSRNEDILSGLHSNTHLVLVNGFAQRFQITKEPKYQDATVHFWDMLMNDHAYANGSSSGPRPNATTPTSLKAEHWGDPGHLNTFTKEIAESCVSHNTQKLTSTLLSWTGEAKYAESYMNTFYNAVLAAQNHRTGHVVYHLPLGSPRKKIFLKEDDFRCCNGSSIDAYASLNAGIYYHNDTALFVNLFVPSEVNWDDKGMVLQQTGNFLTNKTVEYHISSKKESIFSINTLIPSWVDRVTVYINGQKENTKISPQTFLSLRRKWKQHDTVKIEFEYGFRIQNLANDKNIIAVFYGPTLLAFETSDELMLKGDPQTILNGLSKNDDNLTYQLKNGGRNYTLRPLYEIDAESYGVYATIRNY